MDEKELEAIFSGLYYEQNGYFHLVGNRAQYIDRLSKLLESAREEGAFEAREKVLKNWVLLSHDEYERLNKLAEQSEEKVEDIA